MTCCVPGQMPIAGDHAELVRHEIDQASRTLDGDVRQTDLTVPDIRCANCIQAIETALSDLDGVIAARVNLSTKRVAVRWHGQSGPPPVLETLHEMGYAAHLGASSGDPSDGADSELIRALAVAGFAAGNIMMLSMGVWWGADPATRDVLHWLSAAIALPALAYSGRPFYRSAWGSLRHRRINMDVPISIGVLLAFAMSLYDTFHHGPFAYFDAAVSLLFFLLIGRTLDHMMREQARVAVKGLACLEARGAMVAGTDGTARYLPVDEIRPGMTILLAAGERVAVDARVNEGCSNVDCSLVSGESAPAPVAVGSRLSAGTVNLTAPLRITALAAASDSFLAEMTRLMEMAEGGRSTYRRLADRAARLYAPAVHLTALAAFIGWALANGDVHRAATIAIAVLIITCPCALGLAVPMVQVVAARRLFEAGIMVKGGQALERLNEIDTIVFDKTGTLTMGKLKLLNREQIAPDYLAIANAMAAYSRHPYARALASVSLAGRPLPVVDRVVEHPGFGLEATVGGRPYRLGRAAWATGGEAHGQASMQGGIAVLASEGRHLATLQFKDRIREGAAQAIAELSRQGLRLEMLSGDRREVVAQLARELGLERFCAEVRPQEKTRHILRLASGGRNVLMVGDGLNDAPALAAAHASMAPANAADVGRSAADFVFLRESLEAVPLAIAIAKRAGSLIRQNFAVAVAYNVIAVPVAVLGHVTPLLAAVAMSLSSILVVGNALRLAPVSTRRQNAEVSSGAAAEPHFA